MFECPNCRTKTPILYLFKNGLTFKENNINKSKMSLLW